MAQITGYLCDICEGFSLNRDGWVKVVPYTDGTTAAANNQIDVCSANCLVRLGIDRGGSRAKVPAKTRRPWSDDERREIVAFANANSVKAAVEKYSVDQSLIHRWRHALNETATA